MIYQTTEGEVHVDLALGYVGAIYVSGEFVGCGLRVVTLEKNGDDYFVPFYGNIIYWEERTLAPSAGKGRREALLRADKKLSAQMKKNCHLRYRRWQTLQEIDRRLHSSV